ncbi:hypothetical protein BS47DRAFT_568503 [Hydnum rufescens UP504]|uniref:RRM domain-containing protein n=1 Tax=Hydnum rufescens UP504 TaxID=1448309 RepID=A0A9P6B3L0_9AGAM|nr:hypothetical protein BS47DRAFT_568503 [Hydnum rufescens UP504]
MADNDILRRRLIVSGLTPAITKDALSQRLTSFGIVESIDGVGSLDGNGHPRKFAHLTLVTTKAKLSRCITALTGSSWKGTRLRVGEARPTLTEKIAFEKDIASGKRVREDYDSVSYLSEKRRKTNPAFEKKTRKRTLQTSREAPDMSLVTLENIKQKKGWNVSSGNRIIRPIRMRPSHPLPPAHPASAGLTASAPPKADPPERETKLNTKMAKINTNVQAKKTLVTKKTKLAAKQSRNKLVHARRTIIDPTRYGSIHQKLTTSASRNDGYWTFDGEVQKWVKLADDDYTVLDVESLGPSHRGSTPSPKIMAIDSAVESDRPVPSTHRRRRSPSTSTALNPLTLPGPAANQPLSISASPTSPIPAVSKSVATALLTTSIESGVNDDAIAIQLRDEKSKGLAIMHSLLKNGWEVGSDDGVVGEKVIRLASVSVGSESGKDGEDGEKADQSTEVEESDSEDDAADAPSDSPQTDAAVPAPPPSTSQPKSLKDMFAPREEEAGFSLFGNLAASGVEIELDLEEEEEVYPIGTKTINQTSAAVAAAPITALAPVFRNEALLFDSSSPMFFPILPSYRDDGFPGKKGARPKDLFDIGLDRGWAAKAGGGFWRTSNEEEIRERWDMVKGDLTREFKKRHREALKKRKRGHGISIADRDAN